MAQAHDYEHCRGCGAAISNYTSVYCPACRECVDKIVRRCMEEIESDLARPEGYYRPDYIRDRSAGAQGD